MKTTKRKVAKRQPAPASTTALPPVPFALPTPISTTLSPQASELVRWYCSITKHHETEAVEGAVFGVLERAKDAYEGTPGGDDGFDWLMEDVIQAKRDDLRFPIRRNYHGGHTVQLGQTASALLARFVQENGGDPRDIVSAAVESVLRCVLEDGETGFPEAHRRARQQRVAEEAESQQRGLMLATYAAARKEVAA